MSDIDMENMDMDMDFDVDEVEDGDGIGAEEEFVLELDEIETGPRPPVPGGWYRAMITKYETQWQSGDPIVTGNKPGAKLPKNTRGTQWIFTIVDDDEYEGRTFRSVYWHHASTGSFWKVLYKATGLFTEEQLNSRMNMLAHRDEILNSEVKMRLIVKGKDSDEYGKQNEIKAIKHLDD